MTGNKSLNAANKAKNDEFYTQLTDIEKELKNYKEHFKDKIIFCNCDDPEYSNFWKYFSLNFDHLQLKKLVATHYETEKASYKLEMYRDEAGVHTEIKTLKQNGDFRSPECTELLQESDIVVTNPPFSLFREYVAQLMEYDKKFLIIGNMNAITYKEIFPLIKNNRIWLGINNGSHDFKVPDAYVKGTIRIDADGKKYAKLGNIAWYTNLDNSKRHEDIILYRQYNEKDYPKYDNYDAININKVADIPYDYDGIMGVPISFLDKYNPKQFELVSFRKGEDNKTLAFTQEQEKDFNHTFISLYDADSSDTQKCKREAQWKNYLYKNNNQAKIEPIDYFFPITTNLQNGLVNDCTINNKKTYVRILIRRKE